MYAAPSTAATSDMLTENYRRFIDDRDERPVSRSSQAARYANYVSFYPRVASRSSDLQTPGSINHDPGEPQPDQTDIHIQRPASSRVSNDGGCLVRLALWSDAASDTKHSHQSSYLHQHSRAQSNTPNSKCCKISA